MGIWKWQLLLLVTQLWLPQSTASGNPGFISIDCGVDEDYEDEETGIFFKSDRDYISTGENGRISPEYNAQVPFLGRRSQNVRYFPKGRKNCYKLQLKQGKNHNYLIRALFQYGNYDSKNQIPRFDFHIGAYYWATVQFADVSDWAGYEIIYFSLTDAIQVCPVNTGGGIPFITALELRLLNDSIYRTDLRILSRSGYDVEFTNQKHSRRKLDDITGAINIDCGISEGSTSTYDKTHMQYVPDSSYIDTGENKNIATTYDSDSLPIFLRSVRSFPERNRNCYTLKPPEGKASVYLIRAYFMYGNYDQLDKLPEFNLFLGVNLWVTVKFDNASHIVIKEIIHVPTMDRIFVCLLNTGLGTPFISALELRHFHNSTYKVDSEESQSLVLHQRLDFGSTTNEIIRYHDDVYDRIWYPSTCVGCDTVNTSLAVDSIVRSVYNLPTKVMQTAVKPIDANQPLNLEFDIGDPSTNYYIYVHFADIQNNSTKFNISLNGKVLNESIDLKYLESKTISTVQSVRGAKLSLSLNKLPDSVLPPILNALEIYLVNDFWQKETDGEDVTAIEDIKSYYELRKGWEGDPCLPSPSWDGLNCSKNGYEPPRIISLDLSSSGLKGEIYSSLASLKLLEHLDLSDNSLIGEVPEFLSQLQNLKTLNLEGNKLSGSVPSALMERSNNGLLSLRLNGNPKICLLSPCKEEKKNIVVPLIATFVPFAVVLMALIIFWRYIRRKVLWSFPCSNNGGGSSLKSDSRQYSYAEIVRITNNFSTVIGKGGFGTVYHGYLSDGSQVAVKMLSSASEEGSSQFRTEAHLLMRVHHKNLASFIGYCNEACNIGIIYEYMANGNLEQYLSDKTKVLSWKERLQIALDAAQDVTQPTGLQKKVMFSALEEYF